MLFTNNLKINWGEGWPFNVIKIVKAPLIILLTFKEKTTSLNNIKSYLKQKRSFL